VTLLYHQGAILRSVKTSYSHIIESPDFEKTAQEHYETPAQGSNKKLITGKSGVKLPEDGQETHSRAEEKECGDTGEEREQEEGSKEP